MSIKHYKFKSERAEGRKVHALACLAASGGIRSRNTCSGVCNSVSHCLTELFCQPPWAFATNPESLSCLSISLNSSRISAKSSPSPEAVYSSMAPIKEYARLIALSKIFSSTSSLALYLLTAKLGMRISPYPPPFPSP